MFRDAGNSVGSGRAQSTAVAHQLVASMQMRSGSWAGADAKGDGSWARCLSVAMGSRVSALNRVGCSGEHQQVECRKGLHRDHTLAKWRCVSMFTSLFEL